jgi:DNA polymerase
VIYIDFETRSTVDLKRCGAWKYAADPSSDVLCLTYAIKDLPVSIWYPGEDMPKDLKYYINYGFPVESHNSFFERAIWRNIMVPRYGWIDIPDDQWRCSASRAAALALPRSLEMVGQALSLPIQKSQEGKRIMMKLSHPNAKGAWCGTSEDFRALYAYCKQDVAAERCLSKKIPQLISNELKVWQLDQKINERGIRVDREAVHASLKLLKAYTERLGAEFREITGGGIDSPTQRDKTLSWLKNEGLEMEGLTKNQVLDAIGGKNGKNTEKTQRVLEIRQAISKTSTAKYQAILDGTCLDGRLRDLLMYHGASTGRWTGKAIQPQNLPKNTEKIDLDKFFRILKWEDLEAFELCYPDVMKALSSTIRGVFIPSAGKTFFGGDFAAIEARVLFWLAGESKGLEMFRKGDDLYKDLAATIYMVSAKDVTKEQREMGKRGILGAGYGLGAKKFLETTKAFARMDITEELAVRVIDAYRTKYSKVVAYWYDQENKAKEAIDTKKTVGNWSLKDGYLFYTLPSGRRLAYYAPKIEVCNTPWGDTKPTITFMAVNAVTKQWERDRTYGGKIVENITSAVARDLLAEAMLRLEAAGYEVVLSVHDEILCEKVKGSVSDFISHMTTLPAWAKGLPVKAEGWCGYRYSK